MRGDYVAFGLNARINCELQFLLSEKHRQMWHGHSMSRRQLSAGWQAPKSLVEQGERSVSNLSRTLYMLTLLALVPSMAKAEVLTEWIQLAPGHWKPIHYERFAHPAEFKPATHLMRTRQGGRLDGTARALVLGVVAVVALLYLVPGQSVVPIV